MHVVTTEPTARKFHPCEVCNAGIQPGEKYQRTITFDGEVLTWKNCLPCREAMDEAWNADYCCDDVITADDVHEWASDNPEHPAAVSLQGRMQPTTKEHR